MSVAPSRVEMVFKLDPIRDASNACSDNVATLATGTSAPGPLLFPDSKSLHKCAQYKDSMKS